MNPDEIDFDNLRRVVAKATMGEWTSCIVISDGKQWGYAARDLPHKNLWKGTISEGSGKEAELVCADARFIATFNPQLVASMPDLTHGAVSLLFCLGQAGLVLIFFWLVVGNVAEFSYRKVHIHCACGVYRKSLTFVNPGVTNRLGWWSENRTESVIYSLVDQPDGKTVLFPELIPIFYPANDAQTLSAVFHKRGHIPGKIAIIGIGRVRSNHYSRIESTLCRIELTIRERVVRWSDQTLSLKRKIVGDCMALISHVDHQARLVAEVFKFHYYAFVVAQDHASTLRKDKLGDRRFKSHVGENQTPDAYHTEGDSTQCDYPIGVPRLSQISPNTLIPACGLLLLSGLIMFVGIAVACHRGATVFEFFCGLGINIAGLLVAACGWMFLFMATAH